MTESLQNSHFWWSAEALVSGLPSRNALRAFHVSLENRGSGPSDRFQC